MITEEINYYSKTKILSLKSYKECIDKYSFNFDKNVSLETELPIFLDTNILLRYYSISFTARTKLFDFIKKNSHRIIITNQVQREFLKNREDVIKKFFEQVTNKIPKDFKSEIVNKLKNFLDQHKVILKDYPYVEEGIESHKIQLEKILEKLNCDSEGKQKEYKDLIWNDNLLELLNDCNLINNLDEDELSLTMKKFDILAKNISKESIDSILNKPDSVFPGLCDIKEKPDNPYGDFIIYHEMMKYILQEKTDIIFLTLDNSKGDWMSKSKSPHIHYIQNMYANTNQIIYIFDAERILEKLLEVEIDSLLKSNSENSISDLNLLSITKLVKQHPIFENTKIVALNKEIIKELKVNGYENINEIISDLNLSIEVMKIFKEENPKYNSTGIVRFSLRIVNPNYQFVVSKTGEVINQVNSYSKEVNKYRLLL